MKELIEILRRDAKAFGPALSKTAHKRGLLVTDKHGGTRPIPITATPVVLDADELRRRAHLAALISSAAFKMAKSVLSSTARDMLVSALSPVERTVMEATFKQIDCLATARVDFFVSGKRPMALELNATIPAMQGYSDIAAQSFIEVVGRHFGMSDRKIAELSTKNGSNAVALHRALTEGYIRERRKRPERMAILCRRNDAQISELRFLAERFNEWGTEAEIVFPDELSGDAKLQARGKTFDLVYRHLFVRRLEEEVDAPYVRTLFSEIPGKKAVLLNPPASQVEVKTVFALLSQASVETELARAAGLGGDELVAIEQAVPWTRPFRRAPTLDPDGKTVQDVVERVAAEPARFVLKRAWDYGGKAVFVGRSVKEEGFDERVRAAYGTSLTWQQLCARAAEDTVGGGFVVQEIVATDPESHVLCTDQGTQDVDMYVDFSAYASVGMHRQPAWGGVCRGSPSRIVNIVGGGGVLPLITTEVATSLLTAHRAFRK